VFVATECGAHRSDSGLIVVGGHDHAPGTDGLLGLREVRRQSRQRGRFGLHLRHTKAGGGHQLGGLALG
jgi:hypothetical protein